MRTSALLALSIGLSTSLASTAAWACGGTFCDNTGVPMPVDQTGEDILFVRDGDQVEAHIRIQYQGDAEKFAWLVPLKSVPEVSVGSEALFVSLSQATAPQWRAQGNSLCNYPDYADDEIGDDGGEFGDDDSGPPELLYETTVGAFEVAVLQGGSAAEVIDFLDANGYAQDPEAEPILQEYLDEGFLFAAIKLSAGEGVDAIHPLVFRSTGEEPCVPIRLTRIAAKQDMGIRAYFLGTQRWAPTNYEHVVLNAVRYDWWSWYAADPYLELLSLAVDEAGGRAFVTEYAGPSNAVQNSNFSIFNLAWNASAFVEADPILAIDLIADQGLNTHALIQPLLLEFIPPPDGVDPQVFWNNIADYAAQIDQAAWNGPEFAAALTERIINPGQKALDLLAAWPTLTRLHTTISPEEMTVDPMFHENPDLPAVPASRVTDATFYCTDAIFHVEVAGEIAEVCSQNNAWPNFADMPAALRIERMPMSGPPQVLVDNAATVLEQVAEQQADVTCDLLTTPPGSEEEEPTLGEKLCGCATTEGEAPIAVVLGMLVLGLTAPIRRRRQGE